MRNRSRPAFTLVEILIVVTVIGLLATAATVNFGKSQQASRDSRRKQDVSTYAQAVGAYLTANGNPAIQLDPKTCGLATADSQNRIDRSSTAGCVGANGLGYGLINAKSGSAAGLGFDSAFNYSYKASISDALHTLHYLGSVASDPSNKNSTAAGGADYILLRCCNDGRQNVSDGGSTYAVWTHLEGVASATDAKNSANACGGSAAANKAGTASGISGYQYDFAAGTQGTVTSSSFAAGPAVGSTSYLGSCKTSAQG